MNQLDKLILLDSKWKAFKEYQSNFACEKAKKILIYAMSKGIDINTIISDSHKIRFTYGSKNNGRYCIIYIDANGAYTIGFFKNPESSFDSASPYYIKNSKFFGIDEILINMFLSEKDT